MIFWTLQFGKCCNDRAVPSCSSIPECGERHSAETSSESQTKESQSRSALCAALRVGHFTFTTLLRPHRIMEHPDAVELTLR